jgi:chemosensory pili system protein ChpA (sensor histidine kinase/response regulator)
LRRTLHTLKGSARMAGAMRLGELTHLMESRLLIGDREVTPSTESVRCARRRPRPSCRADRRAPDRTRSSGAAAPAELAAAGGEALRPAETADGEDRVDEPAGEAEVRQRATVRVRSDVIDRLVNETRRSVDCARADSKASCAH